MRPGSVSFREASRGLIMAAFVLLGAAAVGVRAQPGGEGVPMDRAPFHVPVFENDRVIVLEITIPPGRNTGFHTHFADSLSVNLSPALRTDQRYGSPEITTTTTDNGGEPGRTSFNNVTEGGRYTHKVTNIGPTRFHLISTILKDREGPATVVSDRSQADGYELILDNSRLRAWRVILRPGETAGEITQLAPALRVYIRGGVLDVRVPGAEDRGMAPYDGNFIWLEPGETRSVTNTGTTIVEFVEFEIK
jgi:hypothetical protein